MTDPLLYIGIVSHSAIKHPAKLALDALHQTFPFPRIATDDLRAAPGLVLARCLIATAFLQHPAKPSHLLVVDDDVGGYTGEDVARMMTSGEDLIGGPLPGRRVDMEHLGSAIRRGVPPERLRHFLSPAVMVFAQKDGRANAPGGLVNGHLLPVSFVPTGFMLISRRCLERITNEITSTPQWKTLNGEPIVTSFEFGAEARGGEWIGEDMAFCERWKSIGGTVYCDTKVALTHTGDVTFEGESLEAQLLASRTPRYDWTSADLSAERVR